jgi:predicted metal-binding membrane protein
VLRRQPALAVDAAVVAAWALTAAPVSHALHHGGLGARVGLWALMCVAMMLPSATPAVEYVARNSLSWRRGRAVAGFVAVYLGIWIAYGAVALTLAGLAPAPTAQAVAAALLIAACWELTPLKRSALRACHRGAPLRARGWRATASVIRFGARNAGACVGSCWALMLVMVLVTSGHLLWMAGLTAIVCAQKLLPRPRRSTRITAAVLAAAAAIVLVAG